MRGWVQCMFCIVRHLSISRARTQHLHVITLHCFLVLVHLILCSPIPFTWFRGFGNDAPTSFNLKQFIYTPWHSFLRARPQRGWQCFIPPHRLCIPSYHPYASKSASGRVNEQTYLNMSTCIQHGHMFLYIHYIYIYWAYITTLMSLKEASLRC